jgi:hypothetical protein
MHGMNIWMRLGLFFVIVAILCFAAVEAFSRFPDLYLHKKLIAGSLAGCGFLLWIIARMNSNSEDTYQKSDPVFTTQFFGTILAACGGIVANITPISHFVASPQSVLRVQGLPHLPRLFRKETASARRPKPNDDSLRVQGIFYRTNDPSAIINGKTVFVGDTVGAARIVAIERQSVTVQVSQERKVLGFRL